MPGQRARSDARRYPSIDPLDSWSKYIGLIDPNKVARVRKLLSRGNEIRQMMTVVGEEGTPISDFTTMLKSEFFDNVFLQQNAFDEVDAATSAERQQFVFDKVLDIIDMDFGFEDKDEARRVIMKATDRYRNWNYAAWDSDEFKKMLGEIDDFIARKGRRKVNAAESVASQGAN